MPIALLQKYFNKWLATAWDLFGVDESSSANWSYVYGLKARYDEGENPAPADKSRLNEHARELYRGEVEQLVESANRLIPEGEAKLYLPDLRFNRKIGAYKGETWSVDGRRLASDEYARHLREVLPQADDIAHANAFMKTTEWIAPKRAEA